ncbi:MAG: aspartate aminotransferase family protein [Acidobacteria bacterium]|nr:aspartate aminotransferase family protein [Acidobacteriota bacterium]MXX87321.1 aspartate aminotransferase family protein [Acidobacteriota bacterium]MYG74408.1 aspartate aminotransferase family protein [Acidobacteriota bacterium]
MSQTSKTALLERDAEHLIHPIHSGAATAAGHVWVRGEGARLFDADGRDYVDALSGLWNVFIGHGRPELAEAAAAQMRQLAYASGYAGSSNPQAIALAETLADMAYPSINRFFLTSGGGESTDSSIKTARYFWKVRGKPEKTKVISRIWGYHGVTLAAMCATGMSVYWPMFEPRIPGFRHISSPYPYFYDPPPGKTRGEAAADELETAILEEGPDTVAMFIAEPVQGAGGVIVPTDDYFPRIREICDRYDVLLVSDEVITGFGRTGTTFGLNHWGIEPDIMQFAKAITSGHIPLGGIGLSDRVAATLDEGDAVWMHAYTYSAHPVSCAVALENLRIIREEGLVEMAAEKGAELIRNLEQACGGHPNVGEVRGKGLMAAVEVVADRGTRELFPASEKVGPRLLKAIDERGVFSRLRGDVFVCAPPVCSTSADLAQIADAVAGALEEVLG